MLSASACHLRCSVLVLRLRWLLALCALIVTGLCHAEPISVTLPTGEPVPHGESPPNLRSLGPLEYSGTWECRWGDSPRDATGQLQWAKPTSHS